MAKLSQQLKKVDTSVRQTRTERVKSSQLSIRTEVERKRFEKGKEDAKEKLEGASFDNYESVYNKIEPRFREGFVTPIELKQSTEFKNYQSQQQQSAKIQMVLSRASKIDRGKPFMLMDLSPADQRLVIDYREGIGTGSKQERRARYLQQQFPAIEKGEISRVVSEGTVTQFGVGQTHFGLDVGEKVKVTTRDTKTGDIKKEVVVSKSLDPETKKPIVQKATTTFLDKTERDALRQKEYGSLFPDKVEEKPVEDTRSISEKSIEELIIAPGKQKVGEGFSFIGKKFGEGRSFLKKNVRFDIGGTGSFPKLTFKFGEDDQLADIPSVVTSGQEKLGGVSSIVKEKELKRQLGEESYTEFKESELKLGQQQATDLFFRSDIGKKSFFEATSEEAVNVAFQQFQDTESFQDSETQFQKESVERLDELILENVPYKERIKGTGAGLKILGLNLASVGLDVVTSPTDIALVSGAIAGGGAVLGTLSTPTLIGIDVAFGTAGSIKTFSPTSTIEERGTGALLLGTAGVSLGLKGVKYLKTPTIKTVKIPSPKVTLKASETIRESTKIVKDSGTITQIKYPTQKLSQLGISGRRTIVSTKGRDLLGLKPVFDGVPKRVILQAQSIRGTTSFSLPTQRQKAFNLLTKRGGLTSSQASRTLRFTSPKVIEQILKEGKIIVKGQGSVGKFIFETKQPVIKLKGDLGISTRGASTKTTADIVARKIVNLKSGEIVGVQQRVSLDAILKRSSVNLKAIRVDRSFLAGGETGLKKGFLTFKKGGLTFKKEFQFKDSVGISFGKRVLPLDKIFRLDIGRSKEIQREIIDLTTKRGGFPTRKTPREPFSATLIEGDVGKAIKVKDLIKNIQKVAPSSDFSKVFDKVDDISGKIPKSKFSGTGLYERTESAQVNAILSQGVSAPSITIGKIKDIISFDSQFAPAVTPALTTATFSGIKIATDSKLSLKNLTGFDSRLKLGLKTDLNLKNLIKESTVLKQPQAFSQVSATAQINSLIQPQVISSRTSSVFKEPIIKIPQIKTPVIPFYFPGVKKGKKKGKKKSKQVQDLLFLPDFTTRAIGLKPETVTQKQAQAKLKKILTGFEIRRGVLLK